MGWIPPDRKRSQTGNKKVDEAGARERASVNVKLGTLRKQPEIPASNSDCRKPAEPVTSRLIVGEQNGGEGGCN